MNNLIENYKQYLLTLKAEKILKIDTLKSMHCDDDATLAKIELNIIEIFEKLFKISQKKSLNQAHLKTTYLDYFNKIPNSWQENLLNCKTYGNEIEAHKETLKINQANALKDVFLQFYQEVQND